MTTKGAGKLFADIDIPDTTPVVLAPIQWLAGMEVWFAPVGASLTLILEVQDPNGAWRLADNTLSVGDGVLSRFSISNTSTVTVRCTVTFSGAGHLTAWTTTP